MRTSRTPAIILAALCLVFLAVFAYSADLLPERTAVHFGTGGQPNGWMSRSTYLLFMGALGIGLPLVFTVLALTGAIPARFFSLPHCEYWFAPEREQQTSAYIAAHMLSFACIWVLFFIGIQFLIIEANRITPVQLPMTGFVLLIGGFIAAVLWWTILLLHRFAKTGR